MYMFLDNSRFHYFFLFSQEPAKMQKSNSLTEKFKTLHNRNNKDVGRSRQNFGQSFNRFGDKSNNFGDISKPILTVPPSWELGKKYQGDYDLWGILSNDAKWGSE